MKIVICLILGYLLGMLSPAALFSKLKHVNMRKKGTGNLGASNAVVALGRGYAVAIMVIDIFKSFLGAKIAQYLFPDLEIAGYLAGMGAVIGHVYPFYMGFKGGKGLACYGGMVCFYSPLLLLLYLTGGVLLTILVNRSVFLAVLVTVSFPFIVLAQTGQWSVFAVTAITSVLLLWVHRKNFGRVKRGEEASMRALTKATLFKKKVTATMTDEEEKA